MIVLLIAMAADPRKGSEPGVPIRIVKSLLSAKQITSLHLITPPWQDNIPAILQWARQIEGGEKLTVHEVQFVTSREAIHNIGLNYLIYWLWHFQVAYYMWRKVIAFDVLHQVNFAGFRFIGIAPLIWKPSVWGPIDAVSSFPLRHSWKYLSPKGRVYYGIYNCVNWCQKQMSVKFRVALARVGTILAATSEACKDLKSRRRAEVIHVCETSPSRDMVAESIIPSSGKIGILWAGLAIHRKAFPVLIEAIACLDSTTQDCLSVSVFSDGPLLSHWRDLVARAGLDRLFDFRGFVSRDVLAVEMRRHHILSLTSFREANSTVIFEAMGHGLTPIALGVCGYLDTVQRDFGAIVPLEPKNDLGRRYGDAIKELVTDRDLLNGKRINSRNRAQVLSEDTISLVLQDIYTRAISESLRVQNF